MKLKWWHYAGAAGVGYLLLKKTPASGGVAGYGRFGAPATLGTGAATMATPAAPQVQRISSIIGAGSVQTATRSVFPAPLVIPAQPAIPLPPPAVVPWDMCMQGMNQDGSPLTVAQRRMCPSNQPGVDPGTDQSYSWPCNDGTVQIDCSGHGGNVPQGQPPPGSQPAASGSMLPLLGGAAALFFMLKR